MRFVDHIAENGECFIKNEDAVNEDEYSILLFIEGENAKERLRKKITLEDKTDDQEYTDFDITALTGMFKDEDVDVRIELDQEIHNSFVHRHGVDFPQYV